MTSSGIDTSGSIVMRRDLLANGVPAEPERLCWSDLSPFARGYVEAALRSLRFFHMECPSCEWDCIVGPPGIGDLGIMCPLCAADNGRDVYLRTIGGERDLPAKVEGSDARLALRFDRLAPATLAMMLKDCEAELARNVAPDTNRAGEVFWAARQNGYAAEFGFPPVLLTLADDGLVHMKEKS